MTPEEARALEPDTAGPWTVTPMGAVLGPDGTPLVRNSDGNMYRADAELAAAAPGMRATIAACRIEYGVEVRPDEQSEWQHVGPWWDTPEQARAWRGRATLRLGQPYPHDRIVRRPVGPVEVVEG